MTKDRNPFIAGLFIIVSFVLIVTVLVLIHGQGSVMAQVRTVSFALTDDLGGLAVGDDVRLGGIKVGTVRDVKLEGIDGSKPLVLVKFTLPAECTLHEGAIIRAQSALTGPTDLNIENLGSGKVLAAGTTLIGQPDPKSALLAGLPKVLDTVAAFKVTADNATKLVSHIDDKIDPIVGKYDGAMDKAGQALAQVRDVVGDSKTDFHGTVKNLNDITGSVKDKLPPILDQFTAALAKVDTAVNSAKGALEDAKKTLENTRDMSASLRSVVTGNRGKLDAIVTGLKATSDNLKATSIDVRRSPWRLLYKPNPDEIANLNLYDTTRQFAEGATSLSDAAVALRDALRDPQTDKAQIEKLIGQLDQTFQGFHQVETKLWTAVKE